MTAQLVVDTFDNLVLAMIRAGVQEYGATCGVYDTQAPANYEDKIITASLPYLVFLAGDSITEGPRTIGRHGAREKTFQVMYVGRTREQAKATADLTDAVLDGKRVDPGEFPGASRIVRTERSGIRREETYTGTGKVPLIYGTTTFLFVP